MRPALAGQFDQIRKAVSSSKSSGGGDDDDHHHGHHHHHHCDDDDDNVLGNIIGDVLFGLFSAPFHDECDDYDIHYNYDYDNGVERLPGQTSPVPAAIASMSFARYPYADRVDGYMSYPSYAPARTETGSRRITFEFGSDFDATDRWTTSFLFEGQSGWGLDGDWNYYTERLAAGVQDNLKTGDINLLFRFAEMDHMQWRIGAGINWFDSRTVSDGGINLTTRLDIFPVKPLVMTGEVDYGWVGGAEMFHGSLSAGFMWDRVELFTGYDFRKIGGVELEGPMFGVRLWW